jgi:hypothetical protein
VSNEEKKPRTPGAITQHVRVPHRDGGTVRTNIFKNLFKKSGTHLSLKQFARSVANDPERPQEDRDSAKMFLHNKRCRPGQPPRGIGSTRKKKGGPGGKK